MTVELTLTDLAGGGKPFAGAVVYVWHCTREGEYSLYSPNVRNENFLRGVQVADAAGLVRFTSVFPGCYTGRWPHVHFEVYTTRRPSPTRAARSPPPRSRCRRRPATRCTPGAATGRRWRTSPGSAWPTTTSSATTAAPASSRRPPATRARGSRWRSPCRWTRPPLRRRAAGQGAVHRPERPADERCRSVAGVAIVRLWPVCQNHPVAGIRRRTPWKTSCTPCSRTIPRNRPYSARRQHPRRPQPAGRPRAGADRRDPGAGLVGSPRPHWPSRPS